MPAYDDDVWELYAPEDWTQAHDLAADQPDKLRELQRLFLIEAAKLQRAAARRPPLRALQLGHRRAPAADPRQHAAAVRGHGPADRRTRVLDVKNKSHSVTAQIEVPEGGGEGVIIAQGGAFGGWSLYLHEGRPAYCYNFFGLERFKVVRRPSRRGRRAPAPDRVHLRRRRPRQGRGRDALRRRHQDGEGRVEHTVPMVFSADETTDLGRDSAHPRKRRPQPRQRLHRTDPLGPDRHRRGRRGPRPPDQPRGAVSRRDGTAVAIVVRLSSDEPELPRPGGCRGGGDERAATRRRPSARPASTEPARRGHALDPLRTSPG